MNTPDNLSTFPRETREELKQRLARYPFDFVWIETEGKDAKGRHKNPRVCQSRQAAIFRRSLRAGRCIHLMQDAQPVPENLKPAYVSPYAGQRFPGNERKSAGQVAAELSQFKAAKAAGLL